MMEIDPYAEIFPCLDWFQKHDSLARRIHAWDRLSASTSNLEKAIALRCDGFNVSGRFHTGWA